MEYKDYYKILGISKNASANQIKKEYRKLARKYHPDVNNNADAEQKFKDIAEAYEVLKNQEKRKAYDQFGADWKSGQQQQNRQQEYQQQYQGAGFEGGFDFGFENSGDYSDFFESIFGGGRGGRSSSGAPFKRKGKDMHASISITIEDAYRGVTRRISFEKTTETAKGLFENKTVSLDVKIPNGIKNGQKIRLAGQGNSGQMGREPGDMYIKVEIEKHSLYILEENDVLLHFPVAPWEAVLGTTVNVPTPSGTIKLKIPAKSANGKKLRLKGKGIPSKKPGDFYVVIKVVLPPANDKKSRKIYEEMKELNFDPRTNLGT